MLNDENWLCAAAPERTGQQHTGVRQSYLPEEGDAPPRRPPTCEVPLRQQSSPQKPGAKSRGLGLDGRNKRHTSATQISRRFHVMLVHYGLSQQPKCILHQPGAVDRTSANPPRRARSGAWKRNTGVEVLPFVGRTHQEPGTSETPRTVIGSSSFMFRGARQATIVRGQE